MALLSLVKARKILSSEANHRSIKMVDYARLTGGFLVTVTEDTQTDIPQMRGRACTTRRLSVFEQGKDHASMSIIISTKWNERS